MIQSLRPYQEHALAEIRRHYGEGLKRVLLHLATGGGKTLIFCRVLKSVQEKNKRALMVVMGKDLVDQASQRLFREGVDHGCIQGNHWNRNDHATIQVCSISTLFRRKVAPPADLIVIDEAHLATSKSFKWLIEKYPNAFFLPVSATPHVKKGLRHVADCVVYPISIKDLIAQNYLSRPKYYVPTHVNLSGITIDKKTGDYDQDQLEGRMMNNATLYGDVIRHYRVICPNEPAVLFAVSVAHSKEMVRRFNDAGIAAVHIDAKTTKADREITLEQLRTGAIKVISNVGILTTGVDIPYLKAVILFRPTKSYNLFIQMIGRGTRAIPGKSDFFVLDHANNLEEHGPIEFEMACNLDGVQKRKSVPKPVICKQCFFAFFRVPFERAICPECSFDNSATLEEREAERSTECDDSAQLAEFKIDLNSPQAEMNFNLNKWIAQANNKGYKPGWVFYQIKEKYGEDLAKQNWHIIKRSVKTSRPDRGGDHSSLVPT